MSAFKILTSKHDYIQKNGEKPSEYNEDKIIEAMQEYARIQIEKDLDIVKTKFNSNPLQTLEYVLESTPINLD